MSWATKLSYPPDARCNVSVKSTTFQKGRWEKAAKLHGMATAGAFAAYAADMYLALKRAFEDANHEHHESLNPTNPGEEASRREA
ncbi:MAG: hypothetical protein WAM82_09535 [Thermoanaerobaculia bacterium]